MSFDIYLLTFGKDESGDRLRFNRLIVEKAFETIALDRKSDYWPMEMPDGLLTLGTVSIDLQSRIEGFSVNSPPAAMAFWDAMYDVLRQTPTLLAWPGRGPSYCVTLSNYAGLAPAGMIEELGEPTVVTSGADISAAIEASA